jgi:hypothetical protein
MTERLDYEIRLKDLFAKTMSGAIKQTETLDKKFTDLSGKLGGMESGFRKVGAAIAGAFAVYKVVDFAKQVVTHFGEYQKFLISIKTLLHGDGLAAEALNNQLTQLALITPFQLTDIREAAMQMIGMGIPAAKLTSTLKTLGDIAAGTGSDLKQVSYVYSVIKSMRTADHLHLKELAIRGIPIYKYLSKEFAGITKFTQDEIQHGGKKIKISFEQVEQAMSKMASAGGDFANIMSAQSKGVAGTLSNIEDAWTNLQTNIGRSQENIIASTLNFVQRIVGAANTFVDFTNFRDAATSKMSDGDRLNSIFKGKDHSRDRLYSAYKGDFKHGERKYFETDLERQDFLGKNAQYSSGEMIGSQERFDNFTKGLYGKFNAVAGMSGIEQIKGRAQFMGELKNTHAETLKLLSQSRISSMLAGNQFAVIDSLVSKVKGLARLNNIAPPAVAGHDKNKEGDLGTGLETSMRRPQTLNIYITKLIEQMLVQAQTMSETPQEIKKMVAQAIIEAINDINYSDTTK